MIPIDVSGRMPIAFVVVLLVAGCGGSTKSPVDAGPPPVNQCVGASDLAIMQSLAAALDGGVPDGGASDGGLSDGGVYPYVYLQALGDQVAQCSDQSTCLPAIITDDNPEQCINDCLNSTPATGISVGCVGCYVELIRCTGQYCATLCLGSNPAMCEACAQEHCGTRMAECTGIYGRP